MNMKISLLTSIALFLTVVARAQTNTSVVSQTGTRQSATAVQVGSGNNSLIRQITGTSTTANVGNEAITTQTGTGSPVTNQVIINQSNGAFSNTATVSQTFSRSTGATPNVATVEQGQNASRNAATITQSGSNKVAEIQQIIGSADNAAVISQLSATGDGNAVIQQSTQSGHNQGRITQSGTSQIQYGIIYQNETSYYNQAILLQAGTSDVALISQSFESANNEATIRQGVAGTNNLATINQTNAYDGMSAGASTRVGAANSASISQNQTTASSMGNSAVITQGSFDPSPATGTVVISAGNQAITAQENDVNVSDLLQVGVGNTATVTQNGNSTLKGVDGMAGVNSTAGQYGDTNTLTVTQSGTLANPNVGNVTQIGTGNVSTISQRVPVQ